MPKVRAADIAAQALTLAGRRLDAADELFASAQAELMEAINQERPTWLPAQQESVHQAEQAAQEAIQALADAYDRLVSERTTLTGLESVPQGGNILSVNFGRQSERVRAARAQARENAAGPSSTNGVILPGVDSLLGAFRQLIRQ